MFDRMAYPTAMQKTPPKGAVKILAENLTRLINRDGKRLSQESVAGKSGLKQPTIGRAMRGDSAANLDTLQGLAKAFKLLPWQLLVPDLDPDNEPKLAQSNDKVGALTDIEVELVLTHRKMMRDAFDEDRLRHPGKMKAE